MTEIRSSCIIIKEYQFFYEIVYKKYKLFYKSAILDNHPPVRRVESNKARQRKVQKCLRINIQTSAES